jgi:threonine dehydratase
VHNRAFSRVNLGETAVDITLETRGAEHIEQLVQVFRDRGYEHERLF